MAGTVHYLDPNGDAGSVDYTKVDDGVRQPDPGDNTWDIVYWEEGAYSFEGTTISGGAVSVTAWLYAYYNQAGQMTIELYVGEPGEGGDGQGSHTLESPYGEWVSHEWSGLALDQSDVNDLWLKVDSLDGQTDLDAVYLEVEEGEGGGGGGAGARSFTVV
ncbi:MAG: hypothetical protein ACOC7S_00865 [Planctomycetota bacterium]